MSSNPVSIRGAQPPATSPEEAVWHLLETVIDPEIGIPITDLGLVYSVEVSEGTARVVMTTTTPVCPLGAFIQRQVERGVTGIEGIKRVEVEIVHDPPWSPEMITDTGRRLLGW
jgi:metal-sulfur cluster biosynthetic enzyme